MTASSFTLKSDMLPDVAIRTALVSDCEDLRGWKNANRSSFFFQGLITPEGQRRWFNGYFERPEDWMFIVLADDETVGSMGFRLTDGAADIYNVILGQPEHGGRGVMGAGMRLMCSYIKTLADCPVVARVVKGNPAVAWYEKQGFRVSAEEDSHYLLKLDTDDWLPVAFTRTDTQPLVGPLNPASTD